MDADGYSRFTEHLGRYFTLITPAKEEGREKIRYAEFSCRSLITICFLFGGYSPDGETLNLEEFYPQKRIYPWGRKFVLTLYLEGEKRPLHIRMEARS